jgi:hypothetical protein
MQRMLRISVGEGGRRRSEQRGAAATKRQQRIHPRAERGRGKARCRDESRSNGERSRSWMGQEEREGSGRPGGCQCVPTRCRVRLAVTDLALRHLPSPWPEPEPAKLTYGASPAPACLHFRSFPSTLSSEAAVAHPQAVMSTSFSGAPASFPLAKPSPTMPPPAPLVSQAVLSAPLRLPSAAQEPARLDCRRFITRPKLPISYKETPMQTTSQNKRSAQRVYARRPTPKRNTRCLPGENKRLITPRSYLHHHASFC